MEITLDSIRRELAEAELDDGLVLFGTLMTVTAIGLALLVQLLTSPHGPRTAVLLLPALVLAGHLVRCWRRAKLHERLEERFGLSYEILVQCSELGGAEPELQRLVSDALRVCITINRIAHHTAWERAAIGLEPELTAVREALLYLLRKARAAEQVRAVAELCRQSVRDPERLHGVEARLAAQREELLGLLDALEEVLAELTGALAAAIESRPREAVERQVQGVAGGLAGLARTFEGRGGVERLSSAHQDGPPLLMGLE